MSITGYVKQRYIQCDMESQEELQLIVPEEGNKNVKNVFTEGVTFDLGIKMCKSCQAEK